MADYLNNFSLEGKVALITGASYGIGFAIAESYAEAGATVVFNCSSEASLERGLAAYKEKGIDAHGYVCDVTDEEAVKKMIADIEEKIGTVDILVNNAGISKEMPFLDMPVEVFDEICETNLRSVMLMMKAVLPYMKEQKSGNVVNIGSGAAIRGLPGSAAYSVSKAGVICLTQAVGDEVWPFGIRINAICPGSVDTELFQKSERRNYILSAGGDLFKPETVANGVAFLASDLSEGMNSQVLIMRGFNRW